MNGSSLLLPASVCGGGLAPQMRQPVPPWPAAGRFRCRCCRDPGCLSTHRQGHDRSMNGANGHKRLIRPREGRMIAGVCAGIGDYFGIDANVVRIIFAALTIFTAGAGALIYLVAWAVLPEEGEKSSIVENYLNKKKSG